MAEQPVITVSTLCRRVRGGVTNLHIDGLIGRYWSTASPMSVAKQLKFLVCMLAGDEPMQARMHVRVDTPSGRRMDANAVDVVFSQSKSWHRLLPLPDVFEYGLHWLSVLVNDTVERRIPFEVLPGVAPDRPGN